jgi:hypothetical protein
MALILLKDLITDLSGAVANFLNKHCLINLVVNWNSLMGELGTKKKESLYEIPYERLFLFARIVRILHSLIIFRVISRKLSDEGNLYSFIS